MALLCLLYFICVSACLSLAGVLAEDALPARVPRRWMWCVVVTLSLLVPPFISIQHSSPAFILWANGALGLSMPSAADAAPHTMLDRNWLDCGGEYGQIFNKVWLVSSIMLLTWGVANAFRISRVSRSVRGDANRKALVDGVPVIVTDSLGPATVGFWRSRVLVPEWVLSLPGTQRQYVLRHEDEHRRAKDARLLCVMSIIVSLMPWNLPLWWQLRRLRLAVEMDCDTRVVTSLGDAPAYGELLLKVAQAASRGPRLQPALLGVGELERRLTVLLAPAQRRLARRVLAPALAISLLLVVLSVPHPELDHHVRSHIQTTQ